MNIHEYQAKQLFAKYGMPVPKGEIARTVEDALAIAKNHGSDNWVVKAQVHAGGRGKAGGVKIVSSKEELSNAAKGMLGTNLVTFQTDEKGQPVNQLLIEEVSKIENELYLGAVIDREKQRVVIMASTEGGVNIEEVAEKTPEKILKITVDPFLGVLPFQARELGFALGFNKDQVKQFAKLVMGLAKMFVELDLSLVEINPLVITADGNLLCLDGKINIDDNALGRQPEIREMRDTTQEDDKENHANDWELSYIALDGDIVLHARFLDSQ